jgi:hypothetical protein
MSDKSSAKRSFKREAESVARDERSIQAGVDRIDSRRPAKEPSKEPVQADRREYPAKFPEQHLKKPGNEVDLEQRPMFEAPAYKGSDKLMDKVALITGGDSGIGRAIAVLYAREGADIVIAYLDEDEDAAVTKRAVEAEGRRCSTLAGDVADPKFCEAAVAEAIKAFGKLDILVNNAAFQEHVQKFEDLTEEHFDRTLKTNFTVTSTWPRRPCRT